MSDEHREDKGFFKSKANLALIGFALIAAFFLLTEHTAHVLGILPYLLLLACPLLHFFGHGGHGGHGSDERAGESADAQKSKRPPDSAPGSKAPGSEQPHQH